jgi:hypothetical protein
MYVCTSCKERIKMRERAGTLHAEGVDPGLRSERNKPVSVRGTIQKCSAPRNLIICCFEYVILSEKKYSEIYNTRNLTNTNVTSHNCGFQHTHTFLSYSRISHVLRSVCSYHAQVNVLQLHLLAR